MNETLAMIRLFVLSIALCLAYVGFAQKKVAVGRPAGAICYAKPGDVHTLIPHPKKYLQVISSARVKAANIQVTYENFPADAQTAFQHAVDIWESLLTSTITIRVHARWAPLGGSVLGSASPGTYFTNFEGAQRTGVWYPVALAEKMARKELNDAGDPDIVATFSSSANWNLSVNNPPGAGQYDLVTIVLHEIGHGLGITHAYSVDGDDGIINQAFSGRPVLFETNIETQAGINLVSGFQQPSEELGAQLTSQALFYDAPLVLANNGNNRASIYAPATYNAGSSIAHLDDNTYPAGSLNALMTPFINSAERVLDPGPIVTNILKEMGWVNTLIDHEGLTNTENVTVPYQVKCTLYSDNGYDANSIKLNYSTNGQAFTELTMTPTGLSNEFAATIPVGDQEYAYFIAVKDADQRTFTMPGMIFQQGQPTQQGVIEFEAGADLKPPSINHVPVTFLASNDTLEIEAVVSDNIGVLEVLMDLRINGVDQPSAAMTKRAGTDSTYERNLIFPGLAVGDEIEYRIRATDASVAANTAAKPSASGFFQLNVVGLAPTQDSYANNFNQLSTSDFFGDGFNVSQPPGFADGGIHSLHPYPQGQGFPNDQISFTYQLKVPIRVLAGDGLIRFDEIVLVEPGEAGAPFGTPEFFDYVVVEGSIDGGLTWTTVADGYDSRAQQAWLLAYNKAVSSGSSQTVGDPSLFRPRTLSLLEKFDVNDVVALRFRLFSDPLAIGWGWAIDNLKIQVDDAPPEFNHQHKDFVLQGTSQLEMISRVTDPGGLDQVFLDYQVNAEAIQTLELLATPGTDLFTLNLLLPPDLEAGDEVQYRIRAKDESGNEGSHPASGFISMAIVSFSSPLATAVMDFNNSTDLVSGNFFSITQPPGFSSGAIHSNHPYHAGLGIEKDFHTSWIVTKPIKISSNNPYIAFDEIVLTEYNATQVKDFVVVEASKDGTTWEKLVDSYSSDQSGSWKAAYDNETEPNSTLFIHKQFSMVQSAAFKADDVVLIRFRLLSDSVKTGWGWVIDNLSIQGPITGLERDLAASIGIYPNPVTDGKVYLTVKAQNPSKMSVQLISMQGQVLRREEFVTGHDDLAAEFSLRDWPQGVYLIKVDTGGGSVVRKIVKVGN